MLIVAVVGVLYLVVGIIHVIVQLVALHNNGHNLRLGELIFAIIFGPILWPTVCEDNIFQWVVWRGKK